jgi:nicotinate-nucleotide--dimethylbenzimidazole phosphoribosyltransferase
MQRMTAARAMDLATVAEEVGWPDHDAEQAARLGQRGRPPLARLASLGQWLCGVQGRYPPADFARAHAVVFAADHGIRAAGVSVCGPDWTAGAAAQVAAGGGPVPIFADLASAGLRVVDMAVEGDVPGADDTAKIRRGSGRIDREDALSADDGRRAVAAGVAVADAEIDSGADLLVVGQVGAGATTVAATVVAVVTATEPVKVAGRGSGIDDAAWMRKVTAIRDARRRALPWANNPDRLVAATGGADIAALAGFLLRAAARRTPVVLDGLVTVAGALVAHEVAGNAMRWWLAGPSSTEPAHAVALRRLGLEPLLDLGRVDGSGCGALATVPLLRAAARMLASAEPSPQADG